jgi:hypothetical protein
MHDLITVTTLAAQAHRGEYMYVGRYSQLQPTPPWYAYFGSVASYPGDPFGDGPP